MKSRALAILAAFGILVFVGAFIRVTLRLSATAETSDAGDAPTASVTEALSSGRLDVQVFALGNRDIRLEIQFMPDADAIETEGMRPDVNFAMVETHIDGLDPPLQPVASGIWRANLKLPMEGRWVVNVGLGEDFAEIEFDAR